MTDISKTDSTKKANPWIAGILGVLFTGLGYVYVGRPVRVVIYFLGFYLTQMVLGQSGLLANSFPCLCAVILFALLLYVGMIADGVRIARSGQARRAKFWHYPVFIIAVLTFILVVMSFRPMLFHYETFSAKSETMEPVIKPGDIIVSDPVAYHNKLPQKDDIVVVADNGRQYIRKVKGMADGQALLTVNCPQAGQPRFFPPVPVSAIKGRLTFILYAPAWSRIGTYINPPKS